jgi:hypothetical protein
LAFKAAIVALFALSVSLRVAVGAAGDVIGALVETNGWVLRLTFQGMGTNGTWDFGLDTNSTPAAANRVVLNVTSMGYAADTSPTLVGRSLLATKQLRQPYPNHDFDDVQADDSGNAVARIALSDFVFSNCTSLVVNVKAGLFQSGSNDSSAAVLSVTNTSQLAHPRVIAKWSWPPYWRITNDTYQLRAVAFHRSGMNYQPVAAVKFWAVAEDGSTNEPVIVTNATVDNSMGDAVPIVEYVATLSATNFPPSKWVTNHFAVFPWVGDTNAVVRTDDGLNSPPTPYYAPYPLLCDRDHAYGETVAVVAPNGSDAAGKVIPGAQFSAQDPPVAFRTINAAIAAVRTANFLAYQRPDAGAGTVYLREGLYPWGGGSASGGVEPATWLKLTAFPLDNWTNVVFTNRAGAGFVCGADRVCRVKFTTAGGNQGSFRGVNRLWLDHVWLESGELSMFEGATNIWITHSTIVTNGLVGLDYVQAPATFHLLRGNVFSRFGGAGPRIQTHTVIGNLRPDDETSTEQSTPMFELCAGRNSPDSLDTILAFNRFYCLAAVRGASPINWYRPASTNWCRGLVVAQNVLEIHKSLSAGGAPLVGIAWCGSSVVIPSNQVNNVLIWNNTFVGNRCNLGDDAAGTGTDGGFPHNRLLWSVKNNLFCSANTKHDTEYTPNGGRVYGWPILYGVGWSGNLDQRMTVDCGWFFKFFGAPGYQFSACSDLRTNWPGYVNYGGFLGGTNYGMGGGDYHLTQNSPAINYPVVHVLPNDIEGSDRRAGDTAGAFAYALAVPPFQVEGSIGQGSTYAVAVPTVSGHVYTLECADSLSQSAWIPLMQVAGTGSPCVLVDTNAVPHTRFYRVREQ